MSWKKIRESKLLFKYLLLLIVVFGQIVSCSSYKQFKYIVEEFEIPSKVFKSNFNQSWQAVLQVMKQYDLAVQNQEAGILKTRWIDNTIELNFADSFGTTDAVKSAKFKVIVNVVRGYRGSKEVSKVTVFKRQLVEHDFLQGWKEAHSDGIFEKTLLYRVERVLAIDRSLQKIEDARQQEEQEDQDTF